MIERTNVRTRVAIQLRPCLLRDVKRWSIDCSSILVGQLSHRRWTIRQLCRMPKLFHFKEVHVRVLFLVFWRNMRLLIGLFSVCFLSPLESQHPPGHLQPLGSHQPPSGSIESSEVVPGPQEFFEENVRPGKPLLLRGAAKSMPAYSKWTDGYLRWDK